MHKRVKINGVRGRWLAEAEGEWLAVIHDTWRKGKDGYLDPMTGAKLDGKRYLEFVEALRVKDLVILQKDKPGGFERESYIGIFTFSNLAIGDDGSISLKLIDRYASPK